MDEVYIQIINIWVRHLVSSLMEKARFAQYAMSIQILSQTVAFWFAELSHIEIVESQSDLGWKGA